MGEDSKNSRGSSPGGRGAWLGLLLYGGAWLGCVLWFWLGRSSGGGWILSYSILVHRIILPLAATATAFLLTRAWGLTPWRLAAMAAGFGVLHMAAIWATVSLATLLGQANIAGVGLSVLLDGANPAAAGGLLGRLARERRERAGRRGPDPH